jgi:chaperonin cofactor prefoldin
MTSKTQAELEEKISRLESRLDDEQRLTKRLETRLAELEKPKYFDSSSYAPRGNRGRSAI